MELKSKISEKEYEWASKRIDEIMKVYSNDMPEDSDLSVELDLMTDIVYQYEEDHYPMGQSPVAELIKKSLAANDMTQSQLAEKIKVDNKKVGEYISGKAEPSLRIAGRLCKVLNIKADAMLML